MAENCPDEAERHAQVIELNHRKAFDPPDRQDPAIRIQARLRQMFEANPGMIPCLYLRKIG